MIYNSLNSNSSDSLNSKQKFTGVPRYLYFFNEKNLANIEVSFSGLSLTNLEIIFLSRMSIYELLLERTLIVMSSVKTKQAKKVFFDLNFTCNSH